MKKIDIMNNMNKSKAEEKEKRIVGPTVQEAIEEIVVVEKVEPTVTKKKKKEKKTWAK